jgi:hypothetical protein
MIKTKYGVIRETATGIYKGYINMGDDYFCVDEDDALIDYIDRGFNIVENKYVLSKGRVTSYFFKYKDEFGSRIEEHVEEIIHASLIMITELEKQDVLS